MQIALEFCITRRGKMRARLCDRHQMSAALRHVDGIGNVLENGQTSAGLAAIGIQIYLLSHKYVKTGV